MDAHPEPKIEYTAKLDNAIINKMPRLILITGWGMGRGVHNIRARVSANIGVAINKMGEAVDGRRGSLIKSLMPSAIGCRSPYGPTMFGPLRNCI